MNSQLPDITVIIVTFNAVKHIEGCLKSLFKYCSNLNMEVIVSDNNSRDGTIDIVKNKFPQVILLEGKNRGFGAANNRGILNGSGRYFLFLNDDTLLIDDSIKKLISFLNENPLVGMIGPKLLNPDGSIQPSVFMKRSAWRNIANVLLPRKFLENTILIRRIQIYLQLCFPKIKIGKYGKYLKMQEVDCIKGACMLVNRKAIEQVGMFDENIFLEAEEADLAYRFKRAGWSIIHLPEAKIIHFDGATMGSHEEVGRRFIQKHKSELYYFKKHKNLLYASIHKIGLGLALIIRIILIGPQLLISNGNTNSYLLKELEAYLFTLRLLWDRKVQKINIYKEMKFKNF